MPRKIINPGIPELTPQKKNMLISIADKYAQQHRDNVLHYLETGEITLDEMPLLDNVPEIKTWLSNQYEAWLQQPDEQEQADWAKVVASRGNLDYEPLLVKYIGDYDKIRPEGNHVDEAKRTLREIRSSREKEEWETTVDYLSFDSLYSYYRKHPDTVYFAELDNYMWNIVSERPVEIERLKFFIKEVIRSSYIEDAKRLEKEYEEWSIIRNIPEPRSADGYESVMTEVVNYISAHPSGLFYDEAVQRLESLKVGYLARIRKEMSNKKYGDYVNLINKRLFTEQELVDARIVSDKSIERLRKVSENPSISNLEYFDASKDEITCPSGHTDVFFFGIPSTGKTCILMGLLNSPHLSWNAVKFGGRTAGCQLQDLCNEGIVPNQNAANYLTLINGEINEGNINYNVNLIDMAGEDFAVKISMNPDAKVGFADMGKGVPELLNNNNDKVFFITVDPVQEDAAFFSKDENGNRVRRTVSQRTTLHRFMSILSDPCNAEIMKKVKAIHIIATKADCIGDTEYDRNANAKEIVTARYAHSLNILRQLCHPKKFNINVGSGNKPELYTFSLGQFYYGGVFEYDSRDSNKLLSVIAETATARRAHKTTLERLVDWFNSES